MIITVFGASTPRPGEPAYEQAYRLGSLLGRAGHTVLTGGYTGTMEAASRGAFEAGAHVIGVTCVEIENWRPTPANQWVKEEWRTQTLAERMVKMMETCAAMVALPGGPGTLTEICLAWNRLAINSLPSKPLILVGEGWKTTFSSLVAAQEEYFNSRLSGMLTHVDTIEEAAQLLNGRLSK